MHPTCAMIPPDVVMILRDAFHASYLRSEIDKNILANRQVSNPRKKLLLKNEKAGFNNFRPPTIHPSRSTQVERLLFAPHPPSPSLRR